MELLSVRLVEADVDVALITNDDSVYYFTGFYDICTWSLAARRF
jgi:Xaa-Pro aminopeptidase